MRCAYAGARPLIANKWKCANELTVLKLPIFERLADRSRSRNKPVTDKILAWAINELEGLTMSYAAIEREYMRSKGLFDAHNR